MAFDEFEPSSRREGIFRAKSWARKSWFGVTTGLLVCLALSNALMAQEPPAPQQAPPESASQVAETVSVDPGVTDARIAERLTRIIEATKWFREVNVRVDQGLVFLEGRTDTENHKIWAGDLARNTQGVVAAVNRISVNETSTWDLSPAWTELQSLGSEAMKKSPLIILGLLILLLTWSAMMWASRSARFVLHRWLENQLLRRVASRVIAVPILLLGAYLALRVAGLTSLAVTVLGGTGLIGLVIGIAFREIAENFLASVMISIQNPFAQGDLIAVAGHKGFVQSVNTRSTLLMTLDGNHVQIPNATIYKETIVNFTANPNTRFDFLVGIGYDDSIEEAQAVSRAVLAKQEGLVKDLEPWVLVETLGAATVNIRVYFWVDTASFNGLKVRSAVIRGVKKAFVAAGISMPDESREVVFPSGVPVRMISGESEAAAREVKAPAASKQEVIQLPVGTRGTTEGDLSTEATDIKQQAQRARKPEGGPNLLKNS
ncbi:MAG: mechanosensitive ion channel family protein [Bryobacterales bacterium]|nr:mechanosensitive ion channel family protein [Bryobacterales bacterium]